jgi:hypothetical protein
LHQAGAFFVTRAKSNLDAHRVYSAPTDRETGIIADRWMATPPARTIRIICAASASRTQNPERRWCF